MQKHSTSGYTFARDITNIENEWLKEETTEEEIQQVIDYQLFKSFSTKWDVCNFLLKILTHIGLNICCMIIGFLKHRHLLRELNKTNMTLVLKKDTP